ncbi:LytR/AlgR family response regulator transcription factor [Clostridium sp.]|uniref:LytR/AlgR family response regulator transcription factor n=1 Tax=Clostridium sp. TaxID=1506 RepID=UPI003F3F6476
MFKIAICDDEIIHHNLLKDFINMWANKFQNEIKISCYQSAEEFLFYWKEEEEFNLIILDIEMRQMSGTELARHIRSRDKDIDIVFFTAHSEFAFEGYEVKAMNYLLKPINYKKLEKVINKSYEKYKNSKKSEEYLSVKMNKEVIEIPLSEVRYFIMFSHYLDIVTEKETIKWKKRISDLEEEIINPKFIRCHRSYIVNMEYVKIVQKNKIILEDNTIIPISNTRLDKVKEYIFKNDGS